eukprot:GHVT01024200.1.p1 GENE.GHVT01024200.1~~GHVT01024200.1.p1  ORF type:complete len:328 (-),score=35.99 GHVT01024200.1:926-1909(-)
MKKPGGNVARAMVVAFTLWLTIPGMSAVASGAEARGGRKEENTKPPQNVVAFIDNFLCSWTGQISPSSGLGQLPAFGKLDIQPLIFLKKHENGTVGPDEQEKCSDVPQEFQGTQHGDCMMEIFAFVARKSNPQFAYKIRPYSSRQLLEPRLCRPFYPKAEIQSVTHRHLSPLHFSHFLLDTATTDSYAAIITFWYFGKNMFLENFTVKYEKAANQDGLSIFVAADEKVESAYPLVLIEQKTPPIPVIVVLKSSKNIGDRIPPIKNSKWPQVIKGSLNFLAGGRFCDSNLPMLAPVKKSGSSSSLFPLQSLPVNVKATPLKTAFLLKF